MKFLIRVILSSFSVIVAGWLLKGVHIEDYLTSILVAFVLAILNVILKPILVFLTIPITLITFGLFLLVINAVIALLASHIVPGFYLEGFWWAIAFSLIVSLLNAIINVENEK
ncbi:MAG TPA: phage holin family protein [Bacteroidales bacterium]|nr:phage holin family protein [Bacteroidales bacterium]HQH15227.1 phage holin family protein [Bacteroidales bacterium]HQO08413.1 phage holin family protein [Bacteroidales bacterium]HQP53887.1 phage holin family protein [Bacteroidales bacterium]